MTAAAFAPVRRTNKTALTAVVLIHAAALTALVVAKGPEVLVNPFTETTVTQVPIDKPPPEKPKPRPEVQVPQPVQVIDLPKPVVDVLPKPELAIDRTIVPTPTLTLTTGTSIVVPKDPVVVIPPEPKKVEPAHARANLASYVSDADYPSVAIRNEEQGTTRFRLTVGPDGRVTDCTVTGSSGSSALDQTTCRLMKSRARFTPARDSDGKATTDVVANAIRWVLPDA